MGNHPVEPERVFCALVVLGPTAVCLVDVVVHAYNTAHRKEKKKKRKKDGPTEMRVGWD